MEKEIKELLAHTKVCVCIKENLIKHDDQMIHFIRNKSFNQLLMIQNNSKIEEAMLTLLQEINNES